VSSSDFVTPLRGRVVIREIKDRYYGLIQLPDSALEPSRSEKSHRGIVLAVGAPMFAKKGAREIPHGFQVGDIVHYVFAAQYAERGRTSTWHDDLPVVWMTQWEIIAVEDGNGPA